MASPNQEESHVYTLIRNTDSPSDLIVEGMTLSIALVIAEIFYRLGSFTLECIAFLATWFVASAVISLVRGLAEFGSEN